MDTLCKEGELSIISKLRWKASKFGGRPYATPTATSSALAASRRRKNKAGKEGQFVDFITEIRVNGEMGMHEKNTMDTLIQHLSFATGLNLTAHVDNAKTTAGTWKHLASYDPAAPQGRSRLYLESKEEVRKVYEALHGQLLQVGADCISVTVHNDMIEASPLTGNGGRRGR